MDETHYRESRLCRLLGNPIVYQVMVLLNQRGALTPSMLANLTGRSVQTISEHLGKLRGRMWCGMIRTGAKYGTG